MLDESSILELPFSLDYIAAIVDVEQTLAVVIAVLPHSLVDHATVGEAEFPVPVAQPIGPETGVLLLVLVDHKAFAVRLIFIVLASVRYNVPNNFPNSFAFTTTEVINPIAFVNSVYTTILCHVCHSADSVSLSLFPEAFILISIPVNHGSNSLALPLLEVTDIETAVRVLEGAPAMLQVVLEVPVVNRAIRIEETAKAMASAILEHAKVVARLSDQPAVAVGLVVLEPPFV